MSRQNEEKKIRNDELLFILFLHSLKVSQFINCVLFLLGFMKLKKMSISFFKYHESQQKQHKVYKLFISIHSIPCSIDR